MYKSIRNSLAIAAVASLGLGVLATDLPGLGATAAFAGNGNGNGNNGNGGNNGNRGNGNRDNAASETRGNGNGNGNAGGNDNAGGNGNGAIASELKWLNAAHASDQAFANANPNSAVGRIAPFREAAMATAAATAERDAYATTYEGRATADILAEIAALDPASFPDEQSYNAAAGLLADELEAAMAFETELSRLEGLVSEATAVEAAAYATMLDGQELSPEAEAALRAMLGLS